MYISLISSSIVLLYLIENETSYLISIPHALSILLTVWKLMQASKFEKTDSFPYFCLKDKQTYDQGMTKVYDEEAMKYMCYLMYPLMVIYTIYSAVYNSHKSWYNFVLNTLVGGIYLFGFI